MMDVYIDREQTLKKLTQLEIDNPNFTMTGVKMAIMGIPLADVVPVAQEKCDVCSGKVPLLNDFHNGYSIKIEENEMVVWCGDECVAIFSIDYCPNCGAKLKKKPNE